MRTKLPIKEWKETQLWTELSVYVVLKPMKTQLGDSNYRSWRIYIQGRSKLRLQLGQAVVETKIQSSLTTK